MKDSLIRIRVETKEKRRIEKEAVIAGFDSVSAYILNLVRINRPNLKR